VQTATRGNATLRQHAEFCCPARVFVRPGGGGGGGGNQRAKQIDGAATRARGGGGKAPTPTVWVVRVQRPLSPHYNRHPRRIK